MSNDRYIVSNQIRCNNCGDEIYSTHVHDFRRCTCGAVFVDGGQDYFRRGGQLAAVQDMSITIDKEALKAILPTVKEAMESRRNELGVTLAVLRAIRDVDLVPDISHGFTHWDKKG